MMFGVGATIGTGIFCVLPETVPTAGPAVIVSFAIAGIVAGHSGGRGGNLVVQRDVGGFLRSDPYLVCNFARRDDPGIVPPC